MKKLTVISFFVLYLLGTIIPSCTAEPITIATIGFISAVMGIISFMREALNTEVDNSYFTIVNAMSQFQISEKLLNIEKELENMSEHLSREINIIRKNDELGQGIANIDSEFDYMVELAETYKNGTRFNPSDMKISEQRLLDYFDDKEGSLIGIVSSMYNTFISNSSWILRDMKKNMEEHTRSSCSNVNEQHSRQQGIHNLIAPIVISQAKVLLTVNMAAVHMYNLTGSFPQINIDLLTKKLNDQHLNTVKEFKNLMTIAPRDVWVCNPIRHIKGETFFQLSLVFQKQIVTKKNLYMDEFDAQRRFVNNTLLQSVSRYGDTLLEQLRAPGKNRQELDKSKDEIGEESGYYDIYVKEYIKVNYGTNFDKTPVCWNDLWDCVPLSELLGQSRKFDYILCHSKFNETRRRFDRIEVVNYKKIGNDGPLGSFGQKQPCAQEQNRSYIPNSFVCTCDEYHWSHPFLTVQPSYIDATVSSDRFFYSGLVTAHTSENYVVVGAKIGNHRGIFYPIIEEAILLGEGAVNQSTRRWIDVANDGSFLDAENLCRIHYDTPTIKLATIDLPKDRVLTGLFFTYRNKISLHDEAYGQPIRLSLVSRQFNFTTGKVEPKIGDEEETDEGFEKINGKIRYYNYRTDTYLVENQPLPDLTLKTNSFLTNKCLNFSTSDFKTDLGQTTIPYIDIQNVTLAVAMPLGGAGLYYKSREGTAGYIGLTLKTYDLSPHIELPSTTLSDVAKKSLAEQYSLRNGIIGRFFN